MVSELSPQLMREAMLIVEDKARMAGWDVPARLFVVRAADAELVVTFPPAQLLFGVPVHAVSGVVAAAHTMLRDPECFPARMMTKHVLEGPGDLVGMGVLTEFFTRVDSQEKQIDLVAAQLTGADWRQVEGVGQ